MNVLIIDTDQCALDLAFRAACEGHTVKWWKPVRKADGKRSRSGTGFVGVEQVADWRAHMKWAKSGIIINMFNDREVTSALDKYRAEDYPVYGPSVASAKLEWERADGMKLFEKCGLEVPEYHTMPNLEAALKFAWKAQEPFVFKTLGDEEDKSLSFVPNDPAELVGWLENKIKAGTKLKGSCILQTKAKLLCEIGISTFVNKNGFSAQHNLNFEHKKLMNENLGPNTGEMGSVMKYLEKPENAVLVDILKDFEEDLVRLGHIGDFDLSGCIDEKGNFIPFEFSCRQGYPATFIQMACHENAVDWMKDALEGKDTLRTDKQVACGVVMVQPPFPQQNDNPKSTEGNIITGIEEVWDHVAPVEIELSTGPVMKDGKVTADDVYRTTGDYICCVTGKGHDVHDAIENANAITKKIKFANKMYRTDIGKGLEKELPEIEALGYGEMIAW